MSNKNIHIASETIQQSEWTVKGAGWMSQAAIAQLKQYAGPPKSLTATITTEDGYTYTGVLYLEKEQGNANNAD